MDPDALARRHDVIASPRTRRALQSAAIATRWRV